ncbi:BLOC-1 related complex subunit 6 [Brevipalpus obovatus]|uniref:BLOC-1 related complex subunit 6 n=1 Tax=Brevipalpus obovatus TaxID=246614 RepID=UPI003D9F4DDA
MASKENTSDPGTLVETPVSPAKSDKSEPISSSAHTSSTTPTGDGPYGDMPRDLVSSYTEISFGGDSDMDLDECAEMDETTELKNLDPENDKQVSGSLSLPQLSSTIVDWSARARAEYDAKFDTDISSAIARRGLSGSQSKEAKPSTSSTNQETDRMLNLVKEDIEKKLRLSGPTPSTSRTTSGHLSPSGISKTSRTPSVASSLFTLAPLERLEAQAKIIARSLEQVAQNLSSYTHRTTALTVECTKNFERSLSQTCDSVDVNIKLMYQLIAKYEELNNVLVPIGKLSDEVKDLRRILDLLEKEVDNNPS